MLPHQSHLILSVKPLWTVFRLVLQLVTHGRRISVVLNRHQALQNSWLMQSAEGQTPLDKGDLNRVAFHFLFPPTILLDIGSVANRTQFEIN